MIFGKQRRNQLHTEIGIWGPDGECGVVDYGDPNEPIVFTGTADECDAWVQTRLGFCCKKCGHTYLGDQDTYRCPACGKTN